MAVGLSPPLFQTRSMTAPLFVPKRRLAGAEGHAELPPTPRLHPRLVPDTIGSNVAKTSRFRILRGLAFEKPLTLYRRSSSQLPRRWTLRLTETQPFSGSIYKLVREVVSYGAASGVALAADMALLALLVSVLHLHYLAAATISFIAGGLVLYALSVWAVFGHRRVTNHAIELSAFLAFGVVGLFLNAGVVWFAVEQIQLHFMVGKLLAAVCSFGANFMLRRHFLFSPVAAPQARASRWAS